MNARSLILAVALAACGTNTSGTDGGAGGSTGGGTGGSAGSGTGGGTSAGGGQGGGTSAGGGQGGGEVDAGVPPRTTFFVYDSEGRLIGEYDETGAALLEVEYFAGAPVAAMVPSPGGEKIFAVHSDHLGTPRALEDSTGRLVWTWQSDAFGTTPPDEDPSASGTRQRFPLRFPGQYFDAETSLHYNAARDYDPVLGRYVEADPLGLGGGLNPYLYVEANPIASADPAGTGPTTGPSPQSPPPAPQPAPCQTRKRCFNDRINQWYFLDTVTCELPAGNRKVKWNECMHRGELDTYRCTGGDLSGPPPRDDPPPTPPPDQGCPCHFNGIAQEQCVNRNYVACHGK